MIKTAVPWSASRLSRRIRRVIESIWGRKGYFRVLILGDGVILSVTGACRWGSRREERDDGSGV